MCGSAGLGAVNTRGTELGSAKVVRHLGWRSAGSRQECWKTPAGAGALRALLRLLAPFDFGLPRDFPAGFDFPHPDACEQFPLSRGWFRPLLLLVTLKLSPGRSLQLPPWGQCPAQGRAAPRSPRSSRRCPCSRKHKHSIKGIKRKQTEQNKNGEINLKEENK